jgi:hypothetical protein
MIQIKYIGRNYLYISVSCSFFFLSGGYFSSSTAPMHLPDKGRKG